MSKKYYVTTSIAYVNSKPHIGFAMEVIQADSLARFNRMMGKDVYFLTGTDEHGIKIFQTAKELNKETQELVDENAEKFKGLKDLLNLSNDDFIQTTTDRHKKGAMKLWKKLEENGDLYKDTYKGLYCVGCEAYVTEKELVDGMCPNHKKAPEVLEEENYFFKLSNYTDQIKEKIESGELKIIPESRKNEILNVIKDGLQDVSFSRPKSVLPWGVDVPGDEDQVMYVWCDALSNYITAIDYEHEGDLFKKYWPCDCHVIGKDILRFHAAIWIGMLLSAEVELPKSICVHGFITSEGEKMSKSLGNVVDPGEYVEKFGADALRYFLLKEIPTTDDGDFSKDRFNTVYDSELRNNLGNLLSRVVAMTEKYFDGKVPMNNGEDHGFKKMTEQLVEKYKKNFEEFDLKVVIEDVNDYIDAGNKYIDEEKPWELKKKDEEKLAQVIYNLLELLNKISIFLSPIIPVSAENMKKQLGFDKAEFKVEDLAWGTLKEGQKVQKGESLFPKIEKN